MHGEGILIERKEGYIFTGTFKANLKDGFGIMEHFKNLNDILNLHTIPSSLLTLPFEEDFQKFIEPILQDAKHKISLLKSKVYSFYQDIFKKEKTLCTSKQSKSLPNTYKDLFPIYTHKLQEPALNASDYELTKSGSILMAYYGCFYADKRNGYGLNFYKNGDYFCGMFNANKRVGFGYYKFIQTDSNSNTLYYLGYFENNALNKYGCFMYTNGSCYIGQIKNNTLEGNGLLFMIANSNSQIKEESLEMSSSTSVVLNKMQMQTQTEVYIYKGEFYKNKKHGDGVYYYKNGNYYSGHFGMDTFDGNGDMYFKHDNLVYKGGFKENLKHGMGVITRICYKGEEESSKTTEAEKEKENFEFVEEYSGSMKKDSIFGFGNLIFANGDTYEGQFVNNRIHGVGVIHFIKTGNKFNGNFLEGLKHGRCEFTLKKGRVKNTKFKHGVEALTH